MATRPNTPADVLADVLADGPDDPPHGIRASALDDPVEDDEPLDDESLEALLREEFLMADGFVEKDVFSEDIPDAALFLPFRDGRSSWR